jgi:hypothetical protein
MGSRQLYLSPPFQHQEFWLQREKEEERYEMKNILQL